VVLVTSATAAFFLVLPPFLIAGVGLTAGLAAGFAAGLLAGCLVDFFVAMIKYILHLNNKQKKSKNQIPIKQYVKELSPN
jgi:TRAP-type C4-dicarboxylate transport system permease large subunit